MRCCLFYCVGHSEAAVQPIEPSHLLLSIAISTELGMPTLGKETRFPCSPVSPCLQLARKLFLNDDVHGRNQGHIPITYPEHSPVLASGSRQFGGNAVPLGGSWLEVCNTTQRRDGAAHWSPSISSGQAGRELSHSVLSWSHVKGA